MNPLEENLSQLALPEIPCRVRDQILLETGRQLGKREARSWKGVSLTLGLLLGLSWLPNLQSLSVRQKTDPVPATAPALVNLPPSESPPVQELPRPTLPENDYSQWVFDWMVPDLSIPKKLELIHASRLDQLAPTYPPAWAHVTKGSQAIEAITTIIPPEER